MMVRRSKFMCGRNPRMREATIGQQVLNHMARLLDGSGWYAARAFTYLQLAYVQILANLWSHSNVWTHI